MVAAPVAPEVVERFCAGDADAVRDVYGAYGRAVFGVAYRSLGDRHLAEEACQQTFVQAWKAAGTVDATRDIGPWLFTIAKRVAIDVYRREEKRRHDDLDDVQPGHPALTGHPPVTLDLSTWEIRMAIEALPPDERDVVRLSHFDGLTHEQIATHLGIPAGTVKSRSSRAHRRLAERLAPLREEVA